MRIALISDTHSKHDQITSFLPQGDLILCAGDISTRGYGEEINNFCKWFESLNYESKIFIPGNHDFDFQINSKNTDKLVKEYKSVVCLKDRAFTYKGVKVYGSPWQPEFFNWAYNLPRDGFELKDKWHAIPKNTDILITHGPAYGILDTVAGRVGENIGCKLLRNRIEKIKPKIHVFGHIHTGYGYYFDGYTHFFNASVLNEQYLFTQKPFIIEWEPLANTVKFV